MGKTVNPTWVSGHWRLRNDDGSMSTATWKAAEDTSANVLVNTKFRLRISWGESAAQTTSTSSGTITLQYAINGGGFTTVGSATAVKYITSGTVSDATTETTQRLSSPTGVASWAGPAEFDSNNSVAAKTPVDQGYEAEFCLQLDGASISNSDTITFQILHGGSTFDSTDSTPTLTAVGTQTLTPALYTNDQTFYAATIAATAPQQDLTASLHTNSQTFHAPTIVRITYVTPPFIDDGQTFYGPTASASNSLDAALYTDNQTFYAATVVGVGPQQDLTASLVANSQTFHTPTIATSNALADSLLSNSQTFYGVTVSVTYDLSAQLVSNSQTFHAATIAVGVSTIDPPFVANSQTFYAPTVAPDTSVEIVASLLTDTQTFFAPSVSASYTLAPALVSNASSFQSITISASYGLSAALVTNGQTFYVPFIGSFMDVPPTPGRTSTLGRIKRGGTFDFNGREGVLGRNARSVLPQAGAEGRTSIVRNNNGNNG